MIERTNLARYPQSQIVKRSINPLFIEPDGEMQGALSRFLPLPSQLLIRINVHNPATITPQFHGMSCSRAVVQITNLLFITNPDPPILGVADCRSRAVIISNIDTAPNPMSLYTNDKMAGNTLSPACT